MGKIIKAIFLIGLIVLLALITAAWAWFGPPGSSDQTEVFTVPERELGFDAARSLKEKGFIRSPEAFQFLLDTLAAGAEIQPGGYNLNQRMTALAVLAKITGLPDLKWVTITGCQRKEQIGEKLAAALGWKPPELDRWDNLFKDSRTEYFEGVYYPDTYLIPVGETAEQVAQRFIDRFNGKFAPLAADYTAADIKWTTGLKIASLIAREAAGAADMKLIAGIIWNRLKAGMPLQIDATMQYTLGKRADGGWWGPVDLAEKQKDSPYNSYLFKGLPPTPICSPNLTAIEAALSPAPTACLYYLHDHTGQIHCAATYEDHLANIKQYLN